MITKALFPIEKNVFLNYCALLTSHWIKSVSKWPKRTHKYALIDCNNYTGGRRHLIYCMEQKHVVFEAQTEYQTGATNTWVFPMRDVCLHVWRAPVHDSPEKPQNDELWSDSRKLKWRTLNNLTQKSFHQRQERFWTCRSLAVLGARGVQHN